MSEEPGLYWVLPYVISSSLGAVVALAATLGAALAESTFCTDTGGCTEAADSFGEHLVVAGVSGAMLIASIGLPVFLGTRAFPRRRRRVWIVALVLGLWAPAAVVIELWV